MTVPTDPRRIDDGPSAIMAPSTSAVASPLSANATIAASMAIDNESWQGKLRDWTVLKTPAMATTRMGWATYQRELMTFGLAEWLSQDMAGADVVIRFEERRSATEIKH